MSAGHDADPGVSADGLKVALLGCGVVGTEVARLLVEQRDELTPGWGCRST